MNKTIDVVILTEDTYVNTEKRDWYTLQVLLEDELVKDALEQQGLSVDIRSWSDPKFDWSLTKAVLFRTTWDYFDRFGEFTGWLNSVKSKTQCINDASTLQWNMDKRYLIELAQKNINTVETYILPKGSEFDLSLTMEKNGFSEAIIKPVVSGAARHTYRVTANNLEQIQARLNQLIKEEDFLVQPFQNNILESGELSLMVMNGQFTHAVRKIAAQGDFRVQDDHGGTVHPYSPTQEEIEFAESAIAVCEPKPLYGRVDIIKDNKNQLAIMELELIEPELFFRFHRPAASVLAKAIKDNIK